ncbi:MAG: polyketide synthase, partial [Candidatus Competibacteraceae bacterium]
MELESTALGGIAVIGMAARMPGARDYREFWRNLAGGVESVSWFTEEELAASGVPKGIYGAPDYVPAAAVLDGFDHFDASFFGYNPNEAARIDPQQRVFLECAVEAIEDAAIPLDALPESTGVYASSSMNGYLFNLTSQPGFVETRDLFPLVIGTDKDYAATRVAYKLNLEGPAITIQTACSSSLVALHLACQGLFAGDCDMALAGGVTVKTPHRVGYIHVKEGILAPDGHCRPFDALAQGTIEGNGAGIVVLKRLEDALAAGDCIRAVIRGSAINNDGALKVGYTAPRIEGQAKAIRVAQLLADVDPETIGYLEAHGTGTHLGDPIEIAGITRAFGMATDKKQFCAIGSVKANIGHLNAAAGIAGFIKTVLMLENRAIPPTVHYRTPNPKIDFATSPVFVNAELTDWRSNVSPLRAGVSSFGVGGTNAHVVLEEAPP